MSPYVRTYQGRITNNAACVRESAGRRRYYGGGQHARVLASVSTINCGVEVTARALAEDAKLFYHTFQQKQVATS